MIFPSRLQKQTGSQVTDDAFKQCRICPQVSELEFSSQKFTDSIRHFVPVDSRWKIPFNLSDGQVGRKSYSSDVSRPFCSSSSTNPIFTTAENAGKWMETSPCKLPVAQNHYWSFNQMRRCCPNRKEYAAALHQMLLLLQKVKFLKDGVATLPLAPVVRHLKSFAEQRINCFWESNH